ncbi:MAG: GTPase HflX, partial [Bryobacteraceae bacterium]
MRQRQERTLIVGVDVSSGQKRDSSPTDPEESLQELRVLAESAGAEVVGEVLQHRAALDSATLVGSGKVGEIRARIEPDELDSVIFDRELSPTQLRNLERYLGCKVIDRTQLILDIFASRARTREGQLQ